MTKTFCRLALLVTFISTVISCSSLPPEPSPTPSPSQTAPTAVSGVTARPDPIWIAVSPRIAQPGVKLMLSGQGFAPSESISATLIDQSGKLVAALITSKVDVSGALPVTTLDLPADLAPGQYGLTVKGLGSERIAAVELWIRAKPPAIELSKESIHPEEPLAVTLTGFAPFERVVIYLAGRGADPVAALSTDSQGNQATDDVRLPIIEPGDQQLVATGSVSLTQAKHALRILPFEPVVFINANNLPPGEMVDFFGYGFAARDQIGVSLEGSSADVVSIVSDDRGNLRSPAAFQLPSDLKGQQTLRLSAPRTGQTIRVPFQAITSYPYVSLSDYSGRPGDQVSLAVRYLRPRERLDVYLGEGGKRKKIASIRADDKGWLPADAALRIPSDASPGTVILSFEGEASRPPLRSSYLVRP